MRHGKNRFFGVIQDFFNILVLLVSEFGNAVRRFNEIAVDALPMDYFGVVAGVGSRGNGVDKRSEIGRAADGVQLVFFLQPVG